METILLKTKDQITITAHLFKPDIDLNKLLVINSATGVKQQVYFSFAKFFADNGFTVITYDYRGVGLSKPEVMKGYKGSMRIWGNQDYRAVTEFIKDQFPNYQKYCLGHSVGALILGMNPDSNLFDKFVFVGTQKAFVGNLKLKTRLEAYLGFGIVQPLSTKLMGYFPAQWFGLGESLPAGSAYDWRTLILNKKSTNRLLEKTENYAVQLHQDVFVVWAEDDVWLTRKGVTSLLLETYPNLKPTYRFIKTSESEKGKIGHVNFFRSYNQKLWSLILKELL